jgi:glycosyltransferase involved in cell wall biosynthesis
MMWTVAQLGAREHYAVPYSFHQLGHLRLLYTEAWCRRWARGLLRHGPRILRAYGNRHHPAIPGKLVKSFTAASTAYQFSRHPGQVCSRADRYRLILDVGAWFGSRVSAHLSRQAFDTSHDHFFGFNTGSLEPLRLLRARGVFTVLGQIDPGYEEERLVALEREKWPGWENHRDPIPEEYWERIREEWKIADVVMVNSDWSANLLLCQGVPESKLVVVPLAFTARETSRCCRTHKGQLTVLWLGSVTLRKGIPYLIEAAKQLRNVRFVVAGPILITEEKIRSAPANVSFIGEFQRHDTSRIYADADVYVLPTISDGFAITQLEAMAHGLPVITTPHCGRVVTDGYDGFIVPAANSEALAAAIARLDANRQELSEMSRRAAEKVQMFAPPSNATQLEEKVFYAKARSRSSGGMLGQICRTATT